MNSVISYCRKNWEYTLVAIIVLAAALAWVISWGSQFVGNSSGNNDGIEAHTVQAAIDLLMADLGLTTETGIQDNSFPLNDFTSFDFDLGSPGSQSLYPNYLRQSHTKCTYIWSSTGKVTQIDC